MASAMPQARVEHDTRAVGHGRGTGGRQGLAGQRGDAPSEARSADGSRAGSHPPAHTATRHHWCGGHRKVRRAWLRYRCAAGPGRASRRRAERSSRRGRLAGGSPPTGTHSDQAPLVWRASEGPEGTGGLRDDALSHTQQHGAAGVEGAGGSGGHGRASRSTLPSLQARVWRSRGRPGPTAPGTPVGPQATQAGRPPPTGTPSSPAQQDAQSARPNNTPRGARNTSGATRNTAQGRGPAGPRP